METRSRKRAEASSTAPPSQPSSVASSSGAVTRFHKRARTSVTPAASATTSRATTRFNLPKSSMDSSSPAPAPSANQVESSSSSRTRRTRNHNNTGEPSFSEKRKEKEHDARVREIARDSNRERDCLGLNIEVVNNVNSGNNNASHSNNDDEDIDSEGGGIGAFHQNLTSASSALQGLLRKLGAGLDDLLPSPGLTSASLSQQSGRLKKILSGLRADGEEGKQVEMLTQLCEMLSIGTEESLSTFSVDSFVPVLVGLLNHESNPDVMLLAARAITHLCDVLPSSCGAVVHYGAIPCFVARLLTIEYMDLAEQSLQALKKISQEHPTACLRAGALMAVLSYLDFFSTGVQRVALSTAANMCKKLPSDAADFVMEAVPLLTNLLQYHDAKVLEHASVCLTRIVDTFASYPDKLDELCTHGLVTQAAALISSTSAGGGQASLSPSTYTGLIRLLSTCARGSPLGAKTLLLLGISRILKDILSGSGVSTNSSVSPALSRPSEQIFEIVSLANELLPPLPQGTISLPSSFTIFVKGSTVKRSVPISSGKLDDSLGSATEISAREKLLHDQPELLKQFGMDLLPVLIQIYGSSVNSPVRHKCLWVIGKLMYFSNANMIQSLLGVTNISSFLAGVLAWKDPHVLIPSLQIAEILMDKLPETFSKVFVREGVIHAIDQLILVGSSSGNAAHSSNEKDNDAVSSTSSRSRRYKRRNHNTTSEGNPLEGSRNSPPVNSAAPLSSIEAPFVNTNLCMQVSEYAKNFKEKHFPSGSGTSDIGVTDDLLHLRNLCAKLNAGVDDQKTKGKGKSKAFMPPNFENNDGKEEYLTDVIAEMLIELSKGDGVSTFEFIGSGVVAELLNFLSCGHFSKEKVSEPSMSCLRMQALRRFKSFVSLALPPEKDGSTSPMAILIKKLQNALSSVERFPVVLSHSARSSGGSARLSSGLSALAQPIKLRLCRAQGEKSLRDYSSNVVLIDPLASLAAVEDFLWPRVQRSESGQKSTAQVGLADSSINSGEATASPSIAMTTTASRRQSSRSRGAVNIGDAAKKETVPEKSASSSKGKGKAVLKPSLDEGKGPQTRNATRRMLARDKDTQLKPMTGDSSSDDEELEMSPVEFDDALVIEDDDLSDDEDEDCEDVLRDDPLPGCTPEKVHDVKLGDASDDVCGVPAAIDSLINPTSGSSSGNTVSRVSESSEFRGGSSYSSRGAMSFAAAAMAGLGSTHSRGMRGGRDRPGRIPFGGSIDPPKLMFTSGGKQLNRNLTIYQAIQRQLVMDDDDDERFVGNDFVTSDGNRHWGDVYVINYKRSDGQTERATPVNLNTTISKFGKAGSSNISCAESQTHKLSLLDSILQGELPCDLERSNSTYSILALLRVLDGLNQLAPRLRVQIISDHFAEGRISSLDDLTAPVARVPTEEFINGKLTPKLARQIQDALALCSGSVPSWCYQLTKACPFLFPFETRRQYFYATAFGLSRALHRLQQQQGADGHGLQNEREVRVGRLQRQKVRVSRNRILDSAAKVMEMYSSQKAMLEVEYFGEVGTGLGPTLEFYTLLSHDLQKVSLGMWRSNCASDNDSMNIHDVKIKKDEGVSCGCNEDLVEAPLGLFPRPWSPTSDMSEGSQFFKVTEYFRLLGRVMAKALQDGRLLDLPLSTAFYKVVLGQELDMHDIFSFDAEFGKILLQLHALVCRKRYIESTDSNNGYLNADLCLNGTPVEDLCLDFTLPGYPDYVLKIGDELVNINNLDDYINLVVDATVKAGIAHQVKAFRSGFNQVFDISSLHIFSPQELDYLLCGRRELWEADTLVDHIKFDHGYTAKSPAIMNLLEIMGEFTPDQQRAFCQFVTGAPRLPPGGLAVLNPKLTIVRKHSSTATNSAANGNGLSESADEDLPSVMTCANYLKLPPYSTKEIMYKKLLYAINEGQGSFDLS